MNPGPTQIRKFSDKERYAQNFRSGVSLHSHTMHSRESLGRLPGYISRVPVVGYIIEREIGRNHMHTGRIFDFKRTYWTPPLSPGEAFQLERRQIEKSLGLRAIVSLTDHDNVEAGQHLRMLGGTSDALVSVEWTVPYEQTVFHLGVHNLPPARANVWMDELARFTAKPSTDRLHELLHELDADPSVLVVLNHPYWDAESIGPTEHLAGLSSFLNRFGPLVHALELNGMRSERENLATIKLAGEVALPVVSGGDRHGCEPNSVLNLTAASEFSEFVEEIRRDRHSDIVLMPQYFEPLRLRLLENAWHVLQDAPGEFGRRHWMTRIFMLEPDGTSIPVSTLAGTRFQRLVDRCRWMMGILASPKLRPALRMTFLGGEDGAL